MKSVISKIRKLHQKKYREQFGQFIVEGEKGVDEAIASGASVEQVIVSEALAGKYPDAVVLRDGDEKKIKTTNTFPGVLAVVAIPEPKSFGDGPVICLDGVSDPGNIGTILRTADWFGIKNILLSEDCVDLYNPKLVRSTMGSIFRLNIHESDDVVTELKELDRPVVSLTMDGMDMNKQTKKDNAVYVFGSESHGVRDEIVQMGEQWTIPGSGGAESLNVAVAAGIVFSQL